MGYYYTHDHLGSVRELCSSIGAIVARYSYDPYGRTTPVSGTNLATFQYAGYYAHQTSGLYLTKYRAYDANSGRWIQRDTIGEGGGLNLYSYVEDDPLGFIDPDGLSKRTYVQLYDGYTPAIDYWDAKGVNHFEIHLLDPSGKEVAVVNDKGGWSELHGRKKLPLKPKDLDGAVKKALRKLREKLTKRCLNSAVRHVAPALIINDLFKNGPQDTFNNDVMIPPDLLAAILVLLTQPFQDPPDYTPPPPPAANENSPPLDPTPPMKQP